MIRKRIIVGVGGSASKPPGFCRCCARMAGSGAAAAAPAIPAPGSMLEMLPSRALSPAQVMSSLASEGKRTFHVLIKPDNLTC